MKITERQALSCTIGQLGDVLGAEVDLQDIMTFGSILERHVDDRTEIEFKANDVRLDTVYFPDENQGVLFQCFRGKYTLPLAAIQQFEVAKIVNEDVYKLTQDLKDNGIMDANDVVSNSIQEFKVYHANKKPFFGDCPKEAKEYVKTLFKTNNE